MTRPDDTARRYDGDLPPHVGAYPREDFRERHGRLDTHQGRIAPLEWDDLPRWVRIVITANLLLLAAGLAALAGAVALNIIGGAMATIADPLAGNPY